MCKLCTYVCTVSVCMCVYVFNINFVYECECMYDDTICVILLCWLYVHTCAYVSVYVYTEFGFLDYVCILMYAYIYG